MLIFRVRNGVFAYVLNFPYMLTETAILYPLMCTFQRLRLTHQGVMMKG